MTEDLHNDIDDLFRSGLEGKEDAPSPGLWSAIEKALPPAPAPMPPTSSTPPATGGWTSTIIFKGLIGAAVVAIIGTATYFITTNKNEANLPAVKQTIKEITTIDVPLNSDKPVTSPQLQATKPATSDESKTADAEVESQVTLIPEADKAARPSANPENQTVSIGAATKLPTGNTSGKPADKSSERESNAAIEKTNTSSIPDASPTVKAVQTINAQKDTKLAHPTAKDEKKMIPLPTLPTANNTEDSRLPEVKAARTKASIDQTGRAPSTYISTPSIIPYSAIPSFERIPSTEISGSVGKSGSSTLKRNNWASRIYLAPVISLNMTTMEVEENKSYGPRIGREHIEFKETEQTKTTVSPGIIAGFAINPRISVQTGISEFRNNLNISPKQIKAVRDRDGKIRYRMDCSSGSYFLEPKAGTSPSVGDSLRIESSEIRMRYITIPFSVRVNFGNDKLKVFATAGTDINILAGKQTSTSLSASSREKVNPVRTEGTRKQYLNGNIGAGVEIKAGKRMGILIMPQYRFPIGNMNEEGPVLTYPKTFSVTSGVRIGF